MKTNGSPHKKGLFGKILTYFQIEKDEKSKLIELVDTSDKVRVSTEGLRCPICFCVFGSAPVILPCGHSFCVTCIQHLIQDAIYKAPPMHVPKFECAMCRQTVSAQITFPKNYTVEQIISTIQPVGDDDPMTENEAVNATNLLLDRTKKQIKEAEEKISHLKRANQELQKAFRILLPFTISAIAMLFYTYLKTV